MAVAQHARNLDGFMEESLDGRLAKDGIAGQHTGHHRAGYAEEAQQVVVPVHGVNVEEHGARGVRRVGGVNFPLGELPDEPCVDGSHEQVAPLCGLPCAGRVVEQPRHARSREVGVDEQSRTLHHQRPAALGLQTGAEVAAAGILPHHGSRYGPARMAVPHHGRLALVGDGD